MLAEESKRMKRLLTGLVLLTLAVGIPAYAHHSFARFYFEDRLVSVEGELFEFTLRSPHAWIYVMAPDEDGEMQMFAAEWANVNRLGRAGVNENTLKAGDWIILTGSPGRNPAEHKIHLKGIERPSDGWTWIRSRP